MLEVRMKVQCGNRELHEQVIQPKEGIKDPKKIWIESISNP